MPSQRLAAERTAELREPFKVRLEARDQQYVTVRIDDGELSRSVACPAKAGLAIYAQLIKSPM